MPFSPGDIVYVALGAVDPTSGSTTCRRMQAMVVTADVAIPVIAVPAETAMAGGQWDLSAASDIDGVQVGFLRVKSSVLHLHIPLSWDGTFARFEPRPRLTSLLAAVQAAGQAISSDTKMERTGAAQPASSGALSSPSSLERVNVPGPANPGSRHFIGDDPRTFRESVTNRFEALLNGPGEDAWAEWRRRRGGKRGRPI